MERFTEKHKDKILEVLKCFDHAFSFFQTQRLRIYAL